MNPKSNDRHKKMRAAAALVFIIVFCAGASPAFAAGGDGIIDGFKKAIGDIFLVIEVLLGLTILSMFIMGGVQAVKKGEISQGISTIVLGIIVIVAFYLVAAEFQFTKGG